VIDVAVVGGGIAGMATAARLQAAGLSTAVFEAHGTPGGCAGWYRRRGFSFDVGATTLVDFSSGGVGGELLSAIDMPPLAVPPLPGYVAWLPDRVVTLHRDTHQWAAERRRALGDTPAHRQFWTLMDDLASVFWRASRRGLTLPITAPADLIDAARAVGPRGVLLARYARWTVADALMRFRLRGDRPLVGLLSMLTEDTVHSTVDQAPLINAALGIAIRGAGLTRAAGGMRGFWTQFVTHYRRLGGTLKLGTRVDGIEGRLGAFTIGTRRGPHQAAQVVCALPIEIAARIAPPEVGRALRPYLRRDGEARGGAVLICLGVPEREVASQAFTHHQLLQDYDAPLGDGNNMFVSVSDPDDLASAPAGHRAVMISTHCDLAPWEGLEPPAYERRKRVLGARLLRYAQRVYPNLARDAVVYEVATPRTYARFSGRPGGAVGGVRQTLANANQRAVPHDIGVAGFWLAGDTTWPGLGTVACVLGSRIVARGVLSRHGRVRLRSGTMATAPPAASLLRPHAASGA
jgi:C-3',4' desaturase CrtD